jgi:cation transport ATPase
MSNLWTRATNALSRSLDADEREAVLGDFVELGMTDRRAMRSMLSLVVRRQLRRWRHWEPWFCLLVVILPVCPLLALLSDELGRGLFPIVMVWSHHRLVYAIGLSRGAMLAAFSFQAIGLITLSWTCAFSLGALSRKTIGANAVLFSIVCLAFGASQGYFAVRFLWMTLYAWFPILVEFVVVLLPAYSGFCQSAKSHNIKFQWLVALAICSAVAASLTLWTQGWSKATMDNWSRGAPPLTLAQLAGRTDSWPSAMAYWLTAVVLTAPMFYLLATRMLVHRRGKICEG